MNSNQQVGLNGLGCTQRCREDSAPGDLYMNDAWSDAIDTLKKTGSSVASEVVNQTQEPLKQACTDGARVAIREYAVPITLGIAGAATILITLGFYAGKHFRG